MPKGKKRIVSRQIKITRRLRELDMKSNVTIGIMILAVFFSGCTTIRLLIDKKSVIFTAKIETSESNKNEIYEDVRKIVQNRAKAVGIDAEIIPDPQTKIFSK
jgi:hypothetical protein